MSFKVSFVLLFSVERLSTCRPWRKFLVFLLFWRILVLSFMYKLVNNIRKSTVRLFSWKHDRFSWGWEPKYAENGMGMVHVKMAITTFSRVKTPIGRNLTSALEFLSWDFEANTVECLHFEHLSSFDNSVIGLNVHYNPTEVGMEDGGK